MFTRRNITKALTEAPLWGMASAIDNLINRTDVISGLPSSSENFGMNGTSMLSPTAPLNMDQENSSEVGNTVLQYSMLALVPIGLCFNLLSFAYFIQRCCKDGNVAAIYLATLSCTDILTLLASFLVMVPLNLSPPVNLVWLSGCNILQLALYMPAQVSSLIITIITIDRFLALYFPLKFKQAQSKSKSIIVVTAVTVFATACHFHAFGGLKPIKGEDLNTTFLQWHCSGKNNFLEWYAKVLYPWIDLALYFIIPALVLSLFNILIIAKVVQESLQRRQRSRNGSDRSEVDMPTAMTKYGGHLTRLSLALSLTFMILVGPTNIWFLALSLGAGKEMTNSGINLVTKVVVIMGMCNHSINFIFYIICIPSLRKDFLTKVRKVLSLQLFHL